MSNDVNDILSSVGKLNKADQAIVLKKIASLVNADNLPVKTSLSQLAGLGTAVWQNTDIDGYIDSERLIPSA